MDSSIDTPRLRLIRLTSTDLDSDHVQWFHICRGDETASSWSPRGPCKSINESQALLEKQLKEYAANVYAVHVKPAENLAPEACGMIGLVGIQKPYESFSTVESLGPLPLPEHASEEQKKEGAKVEMNMFGYQYLPAAWGKGYATEAAIAIIDNFAKAKRTEDSKTLHYIDAGVDIENPASIRVLEKAGLQKVGLQMTDEKVYLAGAWRGPGYLKYGKWV